ncbi:prenyltransferase/squalene oxidase repeat-containing protein [Ktedonosporobacter rubrisoli]|nr:prenyltransferase/squalene oxidase repeat-containing protein [Ktedonosporobacter rubrisoli]
MRKTAKKPAVISVSEDFFPAPVWEGALKTRERAGQLKQNWTDLELSNDSAITIYDCYPYLFLGPFPDVPPAAVADFTLAIKLLASSVFLADKIMDLGPQSPNPTNTLAHVFALQVEAYTLFQRLFAPDSPFWPRFHTYFDNYLSACQTEKKFALGQLSWKEFDEKVASTIAIGKASLSRCVLAGLSALQGNEQWLDTLTEALDLYNFAYQMFDDLCDWKEDYLHQSPSLLLCRWLPERPEEPKWADLEALARELYYDGHACTMLQVAIDAAERALLLTSSIPELTWRIIPTNLLERCESLCRDILKITQANRRRSQRPINFYLELPAARTPCEQLAWQGLQFLIRQWQLGFGEARDVARFPQAQGFNAESEFQYGDVFQRAVISDILTEVSETFKLNLEPIIKDEVGYLLEQRSHDGIGGWRYYPELSEIPPDADDLGQIMQLLLHTDNRAAITRFCEQPLTTLLTENRYDDGSFETWIIPASHRTPQQERHFAYAQTIWGTGPDVDVMANLLYALALYDPARFAEIIHTGASYIEAQQQIDGSWASTWYHGPYYGSFVCARLLAKVKLASPALEKIQAFLLKTQQANGGWGGLDYAKSDPLNTALALLSWSALAQTGKYRPADTVIERGLSFLQQSYDENDRAWPYVEFILMAEGRLSKNITRIMSYGSQSVTTAFVLKAATAWHRLREQ